MTSEHLYISIGSSFQCCLTRLAINVLMTIGGLHAFNPEMDNAIQFLVVVDTKLTLSDPSRSLADSSSSGESVRLPLG